MAGREAYERADEVVETVRQLDEAMARIAGGERAARAQAIAATDLAIVQLHRLRDVLTADQRHDDGSPYDPRD